MGSGVVDVRLLPGTDASVHFTNDLSTQQLEEDHPCAWIHHLLRSGTIRLIVHLLPAHKTDPNK